MLIILGAIYAINPERVVAAIVFWIFLFLGAVYYTTGYLLRRRRRREAAAETAERGSMPVRNRESSVRIAQPQERASNPMSGSGRSLHSTLPSPSAGARPNNAALTSGLRVTRFLKAPRSASRQCSICLTQFSTLDRCHYLDCTHIFHEVCLVQWLNSQSAQESGGLRTCPVCRQSIAPGKRPGLSIGERLNRGLFLRWKDDGSFVGAPGTQI